MGRRGCVWIVVILLGVGLAGVARADRRYFVQSYTPYLAPAGNLELEVSTIARSGAGDTTGTSWENRVEFEYGITDRLTGSAYLNFVQPPGVDMAMTFDGPSLEFIYRFSDPGKLLVDPAAYFEIRANGNEVEYEPKLIFGRRIYKLVTAVNVIGEFETHSNGEPTGKNLLVTLGASREIGHVVAVGLEAVYEHDVVSDGPDATSWLFGPTINLQTARIQAALGWHPQVSGTPATSNGLNLADFPRSEVRLIIGVSL
jgi:hypothetical protein